MILDDTKRKIINKAPPAYEGRARFTVFDALAFVLVAALLVFIVWGMGEFSAPISALKRQPIDLGPENLPEYALRTTLRMLIAVCAALAFTLVYAPLAAKSRRAAQVLVPILDILQSIPVLGYISFTVTAFVALFPRSMLGVEMAAIFAIFTAQAWNMTFSFYQSLRTMPAEMEEAARVFRLSNWQKFWRMEVPFAMPGLIWNMMMSMSSGWFFVVASEAITVGNERIMLPGMGSYIALAIEQRDLSAIFFAIGAMMVVITLYDQLLFRPLVAWSDKFRYDSTARQDVPRSWVLTLFQHSMLAQRLLRPIGWLLHRLACLRVMPRVAAPLAIRAPNERLVDYVWYGLLITVGLCAVAQIASFLQQSIQPQEILHVLWLAMLTLARVLVLIVLASLLWVPLGVYIGLRPRLAQWIQPLAQFLAAFPANLIFPLAVMGISAWRLDPDIWLSPLMILGTQWYILFNVIAGASVFPADLQDAARNLKIRRWLWWKKVALPGIFPYFITGAITACGGAWNASIVSEMVTWGNERFAARGLGAYIAQQTEAGDFAHIALGVGVMSLVIVLFNRFVWWPLYDMAARKFRFY